MGWFTARPVMRKQMACYRTRTREAQRVDACVPQEEGLPATESRKLDEVPPLSVQDKTHFWLDVQRLYYPRTHWHSELSFFEPAVVYELNELTVIGILLVTCYANITYRCNFSFVLSFFHCFAIVTTTHVRLFLLLKIIVRSTCCYSR